MKSHNRRQMRHKLLFAAATIILMVTLSGIKAHATIQSVVVTPPSPTLVSGNAYYLAGVQYEFRVQVIDPSDTDRTHYNYVALNIPLNGAVSITARWTAPGVANGTGAYSFTSGNQGASVIAVADGATVSGTSNLDLRFRITFAYNINGATGISQTPASRTMTATAVCDTPATVAASVASVYGFCNQIKILNMAQDGDAADGKINPHYDAADGSFNVTGTLVYNITSATVADAVNGTVGTITLYEDADQNYGTANIGTGLTDVTGDTDVSISVPYTYFNAQTLRNYYWRCNVAMTGLGGATYCQNTLPIVSDRVLVTGMAVNLGGGRNSGNYHWRSVLVTGTRFTITAQMQDSGAGMDGNTTFRINYSGAADGATQFSVTIPNGQTTASVIIPASSTPAVAAGTTTGYQYYVVSIEGNSYGSQGDVAYPQVRDDEIDDHVSGNYTSASLYASQYVHWENGDPPDITTANINTGTSPYASATSVLFEWDGSTLNTGTGSADGDFYEYRIYVRESGVSGSFYQWDGDNDAALRSLTPATTTTVTGLKIFTEYEYYLVAADVFGNESAVVNESNQAVPPNAYSTFTTTPYSLEVTISDGITRYINDQFINGSVPPTSPGDYATRELRATNLRVDISVVTADTQPDSVTVWYTNEIATDINIVAGTSENSGGFTAPDYLESAEAKKTAPNTWTTYLPTTSPVIRQGNAVRFVVETEKDGVRVFNDIDSSNDLDPNDSEWAVILNTPTVFTPWPTRILNNVIDDKNRVAYPAYYLTDDAKVSIVVYDIKGRPVCTILDDAVRKGGQNIKEKGWKGVNKADKKLGVGLYYIHIRAKRTTDNKVLINSFQKVVIAR